MRFSSSLFLACVLSAFAPIPEHARVFIQTETPLGTVEVIVLDQDCIVRLEGGPWSSKIPLVSLDQLAPPGDGGATAGVSFCAQKVVTGTFGSPKGKVSKQVTIEVTQPTLSGAVAEAHSQAVAALEGGWTKVACN